MSLKEILNNINHLASSNKISKPYIVGGLPRDKVMNRLSDVQDVDITTGDDSIHLLGQIVHKAYPNSSYQKMEDGHAIVYIDHSKFDFSSNFHSSRVFSELHEAGIKNPTALQREMFSRDFTCNTLVVPLDLSRIEDPTGMGIADIKKKILRTPLRPSITLGDDGKRVVRIIYLAVKLGFTVEKPIIDWVRRNKDIALKDSKDGYLKSRLSKAASYDVKATAKLLTELDLWDVFPIPESLMVARV